MTMMRDAMFALVLIAVPASVAAQEARHFVAAGVETWPAADDRVRREGSRTGLTIQVGTAVGSSGGRLVLGHVPQGEPDPGWTTLAAELEPVMLRSGEFGIGVSLLAGAHHMNTTRRSRANAGCGPPICFWEGPSPVHGWSGMFGLGGAVYAHVHPRFAVSGRAAFARLLGGSNDGMNVPRASLGLEYVFGR